MYFTKTNQIIPATQQSGCCIVDLNVKTKIIILT